MNSCRELAFMKDFEEPMLFLGGRRTKINIRKNYQGRFPFPFSVRLFR